MPENFPFANLLKQQQPDSNAPQWSYTRYIEGSLKGQAFYEEQGIFKDKIYQNRPVISRDTPINGGVYVCPFDYGREAVVVDDKKDPALDVQYQKIITSIKQRKNNGESYKNFILNDVFRLVQLVMPYDLPGSDAVVRSFPSDQKIALSSFFGRGVCRHQALFAAYLLERLNKEGYIGGRASIDRNYVPNAGGHAWVRYENSKGDVFIIDPAQKYIGPLEKIDKDENRWFYERPEDTNKFLKLAARVKRAFAKYKETFTPARLRTS